MQHTVAFAEMSDCDALIQPWWNYGNLDIFPTMHPVWEESCGTCIILDNNQYHSKYQTEHYTKLHMYLHLECVADGLAVCWQHCTEYTVLINFAALLYWPKLLYNTLTGNTVRNHHMLNICCVILSGYVYLSIIGSLVWITCIRNE